MSLKSAEKIKRAIDFMKVGVGRMVRGKVSSIVLIILLVAALVGFLWSFVNYQKTKTRLSAQAGVTRVSAPAGETETPPEEIQVLLRQVGRHMLLPADVDPIIATIEDAAALASQQAFYKDAQNGDRLLIFGDKAVIYSPARDIIVNAGPVIFENREGIQSADSDSGGQ